MKKSNVEDLIFTHQQASRLVNLFATSFDTCLDEAGNNSPGEPVCWQPTLTDIHQQVVHALTPVRVQQVPGHSSPTLQLTLLGVPEQPQQLATGQWQKPAEAVWPVNKHAL
jgi:hypothetical protein